MTCRTLSAQRFALAILLGLWSGATASRADTLTGVFSNPYLAGYIYNDPQIGQYTYIDNSQTAVTGAATQGGASCAPANTLCWGNVPPGTAIAPADQYSELSFNGSTTFNPNSSALQNVGAITFLNGTSQASSLIFDADLTIFDNGVGLATYAVYIENTQNQYSGTGLTQPQLAIDADYINICDNDSNICNHSIEAYEDSEGGTGFTVDLTGHLVGDPTLILDSVTVDPSEANCTTCGVIGSEAPAPAVTPEPPGILLLGTAMVLFLPLTRRRGSSPTP